MMDTTQRLAQFETAQDVLLSMASIFMHRIYEEDAMVNPDLEKIAAWRREKTKFRDMEHELHRYLYDDGEIERIIKTYAPIVKADYLATKLRLSNETIK